VCIVVLNYYQYQHIQTIFCSIINLDTKYKTLTLMVIGFVALDNTTRIKKEPFPASYSYNTGFTRAKIQKRLLTKVFYKPWH